MQEIQRDWSSIVVDTETEIQKDLFDSYFGREQLVIQMDLWNQTLEVVPGTAYWTHAGWFVDHLAGKCTPCDSRRSDSGFDWLGLLGCEKTRPGNRRDLSICCCCWKAVVS